jgi:hypothetical protein
MQPSTTQANGLEYSAVVIDIGSKTVRSRFAIPEGTLLVPRHLSPPDKFAWSADGRYLLISWEKAVVLDLDQRRAIPISRQPVVAEWMPSGDAILYFEIANWEKRNDREFGGLYVKKIAAPDRIELASADALFNEGLSLHSAMHNGLMSLSPLKDKMAIVTGTPDGRRSMLRVYSVTGAPALNVGKPVVSETGDDVIVAFEWAPDERSLAVLTIPRSAVLPQGPFAQPTIKILDLAARPAWRTVTTIRFDLRQGWPDSLELLLLLKPISWTR